jgi:hypothetical protein
MYGHRLLHFSSNRIAFNVDVMKLLVEQRYFNRNRFAVGQKDTASPYKYAGLPWKLMSLSKKVND